MIPEEFYLPDIPIEDFINYYSPFYPKFNKEKFDHINVGRRILSMYKIDQEKDQEPGDQPA